MYTPKTTDITITPRDYRYFTCSSHSKTIQLTMEHEQRDCLPFLDVAIYRRADSTIRRSVHRKLTWSGLYMHFSSFFPRQYKQSLVRTLYARARTICTADTLEEELLRLDAIFRTNGYPALFMRKFSKPKPPVEVEQTAQKCPIYLRLPYKGDDISNCLRKRSSAAVQRTYCAAKPVVLYSCNRIPISLPQLNCHYLRPPKLTLSANSNVVDA